MARFYELISFLHLSFKLTRDLEKQRESSASNIAKKKQEAEAAVSVLQAYNVATNPTLRLYAWLVMKYYKSHTSRTKMGLEKIQQSLSEIH